MSIGAALSEARQQAGLTVAQLSHRTRIREAIIYGIERDDFSTTSGAVFYMRGHVRAIAKAVGLDPEVIGREFDEQHGGSEEPVRAASVFRLDGSVEIRERRSPNWTMAMGVALAIVVVFGIVRLMGGSDESADETKAQVSPAAPSVRPSPAAERNPVKAVSDLVVVRATAKKSSWINVRDADGKQLFQGTIARGKASTWKARDQVRIVIGNAGAVRFEVNGEDLGTLGKTGQTVRRTFGPGSPRPR